MVWQANEAALGRTHHSESDEYCTSPGGATEGSRGCSEAWQAGTLGFELTKSVVKGCALEGREKGTRILRWHLSSCGLDGPLDGARISYSPDLLGGCGVLTRPRSPPSRRPARVRDGTTVHGGLAASFKEDLWALVVTLPLFLNNGSDEW